MNKKFKAIWVKALRSRKFKQGEGQLRRGANGEYEYCCLGVARLILNPKARFGYAGNLSRREMKVIGISKAQNDILVEKNDVALWSFKRIATYIEKHF